MHAWLSSDNGPLVRFRCFYRSSIPLFTACIASLRERKLPPALESFGLVILCGGVSLAIGEASASGSLLGVSICIVSVIAGSFMLIITGDTLHGKLSSMQLAFLTSPVTCFCIFPAYHVLESEVLLDYLILRPGISATILLSGSILAVLYNVVHNDLVAITGPVTTTVLGQMKIVVLMILSGVLFGTKTIWCIKCTLIYEMKR